MNQRPPGCHIYKIFVNRFINIEVISMVMEEEIKLTKSEYNDMVDYIERLQETLDVISNENSIKKLNSALNRVNSGNYLTKEEML